MGLFWEQMGETFTPLPHIWAVFFFLMKTSFSPPLSPPIPSLRGAFRDSPSPEARHEDVELVFPEKPSHLRVLVTWMQCSLSALSMEAFLHRGSQPGIREGLWLNLSHLFTMQKHQPTNSWSALCHICFYTMPCQ